MDDLEVPLFQETSIFLRVSWDILGSFPQIQPHLAEAVPSANLLSLSQDLVIQPKWDGPKGAVGSNLSEQAKRYISSNIKKYMNTTIDYSML